MKPNNYSCAGWFWLITKVEKWIESGLRYGCIDGFHWGTFGLSKFYIVKSNVVG